MEREWKGAKEREVWSYKQEGSQKGEKKRPKKEKRYERGDL